MDASSFFSRIGRFLLPVRCLLCRGAGHDGLELCPGCTASLPRNSEACERCALPLSRSVDMCPECLRTPRPWDAVWAPFRYGWPLDSLEGRFKFGGDLVAGKVLSRCWIAAGAPPVLPEVVVPVPLHASRLRQRGFNQALELVRPLARHLGVAVRPDLLKRVARTGAQTSLDAEGRAGNVRGAFMAGTLPPGVKHVAIVDDVMTTGATLGECAQVLRAAGVEQVDVWALARTPKPGFTA